jgi:hypothetical protein
MRPANCVRRISRDFLVCMDLHGSITTYSGVRFFPFLPSPGDILIEDIAHALSQLCRFGGHTRVFYSVAEHSVHVSQLCLPDDALAGLLHDATEAYLGDVIAPLKELPEFVAYRAAERNLHRVIAQRFGFPAEEPRSVTQADQTMLRIEIRDVLDPGASTRTRKEPARGRLAIRMPWQPRVARARFLSRFGELRRKM